ncbi:hypothetical protein GNI_146090, partial [Gregarina niphandrodes]
MRSCRTEAEVLREGCVVLVAVQRVVCQRGWREFPDAATVYLVRKTDVQEFRNKWRRLPLIQAPAVCMTARDLGNCRTGTLTDGPQERRTISNCKTDLTPMSVRRLKWYLRGQELFREVPTDPESADEQLEGDFTTAFGPNDLLIAVIPSRDQKSQGERAKPDVAEATPVT